jgi:uncharacterized delta-60 repeat protein
MPNAAPVLISSGTPDPTFAGDGLVNVSVGSGDDSARAVTVDANGKVLIAGYAVMPDGKTDFALIRLRQDGSLDTSFSGDGKLTVNFLDDDEAYGVAIQADGKIVLVGVSNVGSTSDICLVRLNADGSLDSTFGSGGKVTTNILGADDGAAIALGANGEIYVSGSSDTDLNPKAVLLRYTANGVLDSGFGNNGIALAGFSGISFGGALAVQTDGKILLSGAHSGAGFDATVARFNQNGTLDLSFSGDGRHSIDFAVLGVARNDAVNSIALQSDGKIVLAGDTYASNYSSSDAFLVRLDANGLLDAGFGGGDGIVTLNRSTYDLFNAVVVQADGKIVAAGYADSSLGQALVARFDPTGMLDSSFDSDGLLATYFQNGTSEIYALSFAHNGQIVAAGESYDGTGDFGVLRLGSLIQDQYVVSGQSLNYAFPSGSFVDAEGTALNFSANMADGGMLPSWLSFNPQTRTFSGTPGDHDFGTLQVVVNASDGVATTSTTFVVEVTTSFIEALRWQHHARWNESFLNGTAGTILTFGFMESSPAYAEGTEATAFSPMTQAERLAVREVLALYQQFAGLTFVEVSNGSGTLNFGVYTDPSDSSAAYAYEPGDGDIYGDVWVNRSHNAGTAAALVIGGYDFSTLMHETGHALGLKHPGNYGPGNDPPFLASAFDTDQFTVMSYNTRQNDLYLDVIESSPGVFGFDYFSINPSTPMLYDIAALQFIYGANLSFNLGDNVYSFSPTVPFFRTLWDAGGNDTINLFNFSTSNTIDLRAGNFSSIGVLPDVIPPGWIAAVPTYDGVNNLALAYNAIIENAIGGNGSDIFIGNNVSNQFTGGGGNDSIDGGLGEDIAFFSGVLAQYSVAYDSVNQRFTIADSTPGRDGSDQLTGVESFQFSDGLRSAASFIAAGINADVSAYIWKSHSLLNGVSITTSGVTQTTSADGTTQFLGFDGSNLDISAIRSVPSNEVTQTNSAVNLQDAIAILKMIVGLPINPGNGQLSAYQAIAADFDGNGSVNLTDAIGVLKHVVGLDSPDPTWRFVNEADLTMPGRADLTPEVVSSSFTVSVQGASPVHVGVVGILTGDVDGSFIGLPGSSTLDVAYFQALTSNGALLPLAQFGIYA